MKHLVVNIDANIAGCNECIYEVNSEDGTYCGHPDAPDFWHELYTPNEGFAENCPLKDVPE